MFGLEGLVRTGGSEGQPETKMETNAMHMATASRGKETKMKDMKKRCEGLHEGK